MMSSSVDHARRFSPEERALICCWPKLGETVIARMEEVGVHSIDEMRRLGVVEVVNRICLAQGSLVFRNRAATMSRFIESIRHQTGSHPAAKLRTMAI